LSIVSHLFLVEYKFILYLNAEVTLLNKLCIYRNQDCLLLDKGNNKITELRTKGKSKLISLQTDKISQQPENCENRNDPDLVQAFLRKGKNFNVDYRQVYGISFVSLFECKEKTGFNQKQKIF
jgi:hypothetical protein